MGILREGLHFKFLGYSIDFIVTRGSIAVDAVASSVPTKDNVFVSVDTTFRFRITDAVSFMYKLGPGKLQDLIQASYEEAVRTLARATSFIDVYDLHNAKTDTMQNALNTLLSEYGVEIISIAITHVQLPTELETLMSDFTTLKIIGLEVERQRVFELTEEANYHALQLERQDRDNHRRIVAVKHTERCLDFTKQIHSVVRNADRAVNLLDVTADAVKRETLAKLEVQLAQIKSDGLLQTSEIRADGSAEVTRIDAERYRHRAVTLGATEVEMAQLRSKSSTIYADAEAGAMDALREVRKHSVSMAYYRALGGIAHNPKAVIVGRQPMGAGGKLASSAHLTQSVLAS